MATSSFTYYPTDKYLADQFRYGVKPTHPNNTFIASRARLESSLAWTREEIQNNMHDECLLRLSEHDVQALETAAESFEETGIGLSDISSENFLLPDNLAARLTAISDKCYHGRGFVVVNGLNPTKLGPKRNVVIYAGIAAYVAPQHGFLDKSHKRVLCHVVNAAPRQSENSNAGKSPGFTDGPLAFHTDNCEILSLFSLDMASEGGQTYVSSAYQLYNELVEKRTDILQTLADHWVLDTFTDYTKNPPIVRPMLHVSDTHDEDYEGGRNSPHVIFTYSRFPMAGFKGRTRNSALPPVTTAQIEAMDTVQYLLSRNAVALPWHKGDMVFLNDMAIMHAREPFKEGGDLQRHLLKFYLRDPKQNWPIPATARQHWDTIYGPNTMDGRREEEWCIRYEEGQEDNWMSNG